MGLVREKIKTLAKAAGIYSHIKTRKDRTYRRLRDSNLAVHAGIRWIMDIPYRQIRDLSLEIQEAKILEEIQNQMEKEHEKDADYRPGASSPLNLKALYLLCRTLKPETVVETGVASGASSFLILSALERNKKGALHSIDLPPEQWKGTDYACLDQVSLPKGKKPGWLVPPELYSRWNLISGDSRKELPKLLEQVGALDLFYHDAEHTYEAMRREFHTVWPSIRSGGVLVSDDVTWNPAFAEFVQEKKREGCAKRWFGFGMIRKK